MGMIIYNGKSSKDYHIQVEQPPGYDFPERDYEAVHIPGRNGDLIIDNGSYKNVDRKYTISAGDHNKKFSVLAHDISAWLHSAQTYARLEDTYEPDYYRLATYVESGEIENILFHAARVEITFNCKPQRYLKIGDKKRTFTKKGVLNNPTFFEALPIIMVNGTGSGSFTIGKQTVTISDIKRNVTINSEIQDSYSGNENRNPDITLSNGFPKLSPGKNEISFTGGITSLEVIPKWWTL